MMLICYDDISEPCCISVLAEDPKTRRPEDLMTHVDGRELMMSSSSSSSSTWVVRYIPASFCILSLAEQWSVMVDDFYMGDGYGNSLYFSQLCFSTSHCVVERKELRHNRSRLEAHWSCSFSSVNLLAGTWE